MGTRRSKRSLIPEEKAVWLAQLGTWRRQCNELMGRAPVADPVYRATRGIVEAIDGVAEAVTGDRTHFHLRAHSSPPRDHDGVAEREAEGSI